MSESPAQHEHTPQAWKKDLATVVSNSDWSYGAVRKSLVNLDLRQSESSFLLPAAIMEPMEERYKALERDILDPKSVLHVDGLLVSCQAGRGCVSGDLGRHMGRHNH